MIDRDTVVIDVPIVNLGQLSQPYRFPTATALLRLWYRPWSGVAIRQAAHRLLFLERLGYDVMERVK